MVQKFCKNSKILVNLGIISESHHSFQLYPLNITPTFWDKVIFDLDLKVQLRPLIDDQMINRSGLFELSPIHRFLYHQWYCSFILQHHRKAQSNWLNLSLNLALRYSQENPVFWLVNAADIIEMGPVWLWMEPYRFPCCFLW